MEVLAAAIRASSWAATMVVVMIAEVWMEAGVAETNDLVVRGAS